MADYSEMFVSPFEDKDLGRDAAVKFLLRQQRQGAPYDLSYLYLAASIKQLSRADWDMAVRKAEAVLDENA